MLSVLMLCVRCYSAQRLLLRRRVLYTCNGCSSKKACLRGTIDGFVHLHADKLMPAVTGDVYSTNVPVCEEHGSKTAPAPRASALTH